MNRNSYDTDSTVWSPQGRLFQVEYAMEAVNQGSAVVGVRSRKFAVLAGLKRSSSDLSSFQKKLFKIDEHIGIGIAGLTADARSLSKFMRTETLNFKYVFGAPMITGRLVEKVADKHYYKERDRPYGVGLLVAGFDEPTGAHLFQTCPSGNFFEYKAHAIGFRAQSAKTYLEKHFQSFEELGLEELIFHALRALEGCAQDKELTESNASVCIVGEGTPFRIIEDADILPYLARVEAASAAAPPAEEEPAADAAMADAAGGAAEEDADAAVPAQNY